MVNGACVFEKKHVVIGPNIGYTLSFCCDEAEGPSIISVIGDATSRIGEVRVLIVAKKNLFQSFVKIVKEIL